MTKQPTNSHPLFAKGRIKDKDEATHNLRCTVPIIESGLIAPSPHRFAQRHQYQQLEQRRPNPEPAEALRYLGRVSDPLQASLRERPMHLKSRSI